MHEKKLPLNLRTDDAAPPLRKGLSMFRADSFLYFPLICPSPLFNARYGGLHTTMSAPFTNFFGVAHIRANGLYVKSVELTLRSKVVHDRLYFHGDKSSGRCFLKSAPK